jgi:hypothetical protein
VAGSLNTVAQKRGRAHATGGTGREYLTTPQIGSGTFEGGTVELLSCGERGPFILLITQPDGSNNRLRHNDREVLLGYFAAIHGRITWTTVEQFKRHVTDDVLLPLIDKLSTESV